MRYQRLALRSSFVVCCLVLTCLPGCAKKKATVKGKVTFMNQPLSAGTVAFVTADGRSGSGIIKSNGEYVVPDAPVGETTITVTTPNTPMGPMKMAKAPPGQKGMPPDMLPPGYEEGKAIRIVPAPEKYAKAETSDLKFTVELGTQDHNIQLKP